MSKIMQAALDPSCLMCLTPQGWYSPLRQGVIWPGPPRNFATEPATWYDLAAAQQQIGGTDDASFLLDFYWTSNVLSDRRVLYNAPLSSRFSVFAYANGRVNVFCNLLGNQFVNYLTLTILGAGTGLSVGRHRISARVGGTTFYAKLDDNEELFISGTRSYETSFTAPISDAHMIIYEAWERNDSANKKVWSYPSLSERLRLITNTNVLNTGTHWEAANPALGWSIKTALPAGIAGTVLAKINGEYIVNPAQWSRTTATFTGAATDTLEGLMVFNEEITYEQIAYLCGVKRWAIPVSAGNINIATVGFQNLRWTFPDGSTSTAGSINQTVAAGTVVCEYVGLAVDNRLTINNSTALASSAMRAIDLPRVTNALTLNNLFQLTGTIADLPRVTNALYLNSLPGLTGTTADLPRVTNNLYLYSLSQLTGTTADLPRVTGYLYLSDLPGLTGTTADLPRVTSILYLYSLSQLTGTTADLPRVTGTLYLYNLPELTGTTADLPANTGERRCYVAANVTGALSVVATNTPIYFYSTGATAQEYDETVHNCVVAGGTGKTLHIGTGTSAGDADIQTLRDRGWSVTIH